MPTTSYAYCLLYASGLPLCLYGILASLATMLSPATTFP